jgi:hypothetical protein
MIASNAKGVSDLQFLNVSLSGPAKSFLYRLRRERTIIKDRAAITAPVVEDAPLMSTEFNLQRDDDNIGDLLTHTGKIHNLWLDEMSDVLTAQCDWITNLLFPPLPHPSQSEIKHEVETRMVCIPLPDDIKSRIWNYINVLRNTAAARRRDSYDEVRALALEFEDCIDSIQRTRQRLFEVRYPRAA